jgi:hypothetical protein
MNLIAAVRKHAEDNYTKGWDEVVEAWDDADIEEVIGNAQTAAEAVAAMKVVVEYRNAYQNDIRAAGGLYDNEDGEVYNKGEVK